MTTSCPETVPLGNHSQAKPRPESDLSYRIETGYVKSRDCRGLPRQASAARGTDEGGRGGERRRHLLHERARRVVLLEALPERPRLAAVPHPALENSRLVEHLVQPRVLGIGREDDVHPALRGAPGPALQVEMAHEVLVLGEEVAHDAEARPRLRGVRRVGKIDDELPVRRCRETRIRLLAVGPLGLPVRALREAGQGVVGLRVRRVAVPEVLVPHAGLEITQLRLLVEERVGEPQRGLTPDRIVRVVLGHEPEVLATRLVLLPLDQPLAPRIRLFLRHRQELASEFRRVVGGTAAGQNEKDRAEHCAEGGGGQSQGGEEGGACHELRRMHRHRPGFKHATCRGCPPLPAARGWLPGRLPPKRSTRPRRNGAPRPRGAMLPSPTPPATAIVAFEPTLRIDSERRAIRSREPAMKVCPPQPGLTVITRTKSTKWSASSTDASDVPGLIATPGLTPRARTCWTKRLRCGSASTCTATRPAPASRYWSSVASGSSIMRWTSKGTRVAFRSALRTIGPTLRFGTKWPSITSKWIQSAPPSSHARAASPSREKSADRSDGARATLMPPPRAPRSRTTGRRAASRASPRAETAGGWCRSPRPRRPGS